MDGVRLPQGYSHFEEAVYFLPFSSQKFVVLILSTSEGWKAESTLESPSGLEHGIPGLGIQCLKAISPKPQMMVMDTPKAYSIFNSRFHIQWGLSQVWRLSEVWVIPILAYLGLQFRAIWGYWIEIPKIVARDTHGK